jgi:hypothetical protein
MVGDGLSVDPDGPAYNPHLAYDSVTGYIYVAFEELVDGYPQIFVKKLKYDIIVP